MGKAASSSNIQEKEMMMMMMMVVVVEDSDIVRVQSPRGGNRDEDKSRERDTTWNNLCWGLSPAGGAAGKAKRDTLMHRD